MIESKDDAENKIYHVISTAILKNVNLGPSLKGNFCELVLPKFVKKHFEVIFVESEIFNDWTIMLRC